AAEFQGQFQEALREAEMADLRKEVDNLNEQAKNFTSFDPVSFQGATKEEPKPEDAVGQPADVAKPTDALPELAQAGAFGPPSGADHGDGAAAAQSPIEPPAASEASAAPQGTVPPPSPEVGDGKSGEGGVRP